MQILTKITTLKILIIFFFLLIGPGIYAQSYADTSLKETLMQRSKNQKSTGWVFLGIGGSVIIGGFILYGAETSTSSGDIDLSTTGLLFAGVLIMAGGISFFHAARKNKAKAMAITFDTEPIMLPGKLGWSYQYQPAITLRIPIGGR